MNSYDLVDVYITLHKDTRKYSWRRFNSTQRSRLDYLLVSEVLGLDITSADIMPGCFSDHSLVCIGFKTGPGSDGFTAELFKFFFTDLGTFMVRSINFGFYSGQMPQKDKGLLFVYPRKEKINNV